VDHSMSQLLERLLLKLDQDYKVFVGDLRHALEPEFGDRVTVRAVTGEKDITGIEVEVRGSGRKASMTVSIVPMGEWLRGKSPPQRFKARMGVGMGVKFPTKEGTLDGVIWHTARWLNANSGKLSEDLAEESSSHLKTKDKWVKVTLGDMKKNPDLVDELFGLIKTAYASIGGHIKFRVPEDLISGNLRIVAIDYDADPDPEAMSVAKKKPSGLKSVAMGHDGSRKAKDVSLAKKGKELKSGMFSEMSGAMAHIMLSKFNVPSINSKAAVEKVIGKKIEWIGEHPGGKYPDHPGWYKRKIAGGDHMKILLGTPAGVSEGLAEDTIPMILRRTERKVKRRAEDYSPRVSGVERTRKVWFFEVGDYTVRMRAIPKSAKQKRVESMDVKVKCSCPSWRWNGPEHWAMEHSYQYGRPVGTASFPKINDPKFRHAACKHTVAVFEYVKEHKLKIDPPKKMSEMLEQLSVVLGIGESPPLKKRVEKKKYGRLDRAFKDPHPGIQFKLQPPRGSSQHGPEQSVEGDTTMTSMAELIERAESGDISSQALKANTGDVMLVMYGGSRFEGVVLQGKDAPWVMRGKDGFTVVDEKDIKKPTRHAWKAVSVILKGGEAFVGGKPVDSLKVKRRGAYSRDDVVNASKVDEEVTGNDWVVVDVDSGGTVSQGFSSRDEAEEFCRMSNLGLIGEMESDRMESADPFMLALKRGHPHIVWTTPSNR